MFNLGWTLGWTSSGGRVFDGKRLSQEPRWDDELNFFEWNWRGNWWLFGWKSGWQAAKPRSAARNQEVAVMASGQAKNRSRIVTRKYNLLDGERLSQEPQ